jgi:hypothetical protein
MNEIPNYTLKQTLGNTLVSLKRKTFFDGTKKNKEELKEEAAAH